MDNITELNAVHTAAHIINGTVHGRIVIINLFRMIAIFAQDFHFRRRHAKEKHIVVTHRVVNLHIGTVQRAQCYRTVNHKLHIAGTGSFCARKGNLFTDIRGRNQQLGQCHTVIFNINNLHLLVDRRVVVNELSQFIDEANHLFCKVIAGSRFGAKYVGMRHKVGVRVVFQPQIRCQNIQCVQVLPLIFMHALNLYIKDRIRVHRHIVFFLDIGSQPLLVVVLNFGQFFQDRLVVLKRFQLFELRGVINITSAYLLSQQVRQFRVGLV